MITHDELKGWITALAAGKRLNQADTQRLATELLNTRAELYWKNERLSAALWEMEEKRDGERLTGQVQGCAVGDCAVADASAPNGYWHGFSIY
jgi:hypothetical protein